MRGAPRRRNEPVLRWLRAALFAAVVWIGLALLGSTPAAATPLFAGAVGILSLLSPGSAVLAAIAALSLPVLAGDLVTGIVFLVVGFAAIQYLSQGRARVFLLVAVAVLLSWAGPLWAAAALAGLILGASEGAIAAMVACIAVQVAAIVAGEPGIGLVSSGATDGTAVLVPLEPGTTVLGFGWLGAAVADLSPSRLIEAFGAIDAAPLLLLQPLAWAAGAATAGLLRRDAGERPRAPFGLLAAAAGVLVAMLAHLAVLGAFDRAPAMADIAPAALASLAVALAVAALSEWVFPPVPACARPAARPSISAEDADVDELLSLISKAEEELASKHTVESTVMITDMKSFSEMTEEDGSVNSAKAIQRHRDLLMPLIAEAGGSGKSTGGDGLVAAFPDHASAVGAAVALQRRLREHNDSHPLERDIVIRVGIASGEVVLDRNGRPFIGTALNLAARIMSLGDGGQILVSHPVGEAARAAGARTAAHGTFELKNITEPVSVDEVLWYDGQEPLAPACG